MKIKEILNLDSEELRRMMTEKEKDRMFEILKNNPESNKFSAFLDLMQDGAREALKDKTPDSYFVTISEYLNYLEEQKEYSREIQDSINEGYIHGQGFYCEQTIDDEEER